jgi:hypothetical protein
MNNLSARHSGTQDARLATTENHDEVRGVAEQVLDSRPQLSNNHSNKNLRLTRTLLIDAPPPSRTAHNISFRGELKPFAVQQLAMTCP